VLVPLLTGCSTTQQKVPFTHLKYLNGNAVPGTYYSPKAGESLLAIAQAYECDVHVLAEINQLPASGALRGSDRIFIPRMRSDFPSYYYAKPRNTDVAAAPAPAEPAAPPAAPAPAPTVVAAPAPVPARAPLPAVSPKPAPSRTVAAAPAPRPVVSTAAPANRTPLVASEPGSVAPRTPWRKPAPKSATQIAAATRPLVPALGPPPAVGPRVVLPPVISRSSILPPSPVPNKAPVAESRTFSSRSQPTSSLSSVEKRTQLTKNYTKKKYPAQARAHNAPPFQWPCPSDKITTRFNTGQTNRQRLHMGLDLAAPQGTPILAACEGRVIYSGNNYLASMGNMILVEHPGGWVTLYAHNYRNLVREGERVEAGQKIALMGSTGRSTGTHLHFEVRNGSVTPVDPLLYLPTD